MRGRVSVKVISPEGRELGVALQGDIPCVVSLAPRESFTRWLEAPFAGLGKAARVFPSLLDIQLPFALEECVYCLLDTQRRAGRTVRALAAGAREETLGSRIEAMQGLGLDPVVIDHEGLALWTQSLREIPPAGGDAATRVVVNLGGAHTTLAIGEGGEFARAHSLRVPDATRIGRLVRAHFDCSTRASRGDASASQQSGAIEWLWAGPGTSDSTAALQEELQRDWRGRHRTHLEPNTFLARALATRALIPGPLRCDLRTGVLRHPTVAARQGKRATRLALLFLASGLVLCSGNLLLQQRIGASRAGMQRAFHAKASRLAGASLGEARGEQAVRIVATSLADRKARLRPFLDAFEPSLTGILSGAMRIGKRHGLSYEALLLDRDMVDIRGAAPTWTSCDELTGFLRQAGYTVKLSREEALVNDTVPFAITTGVANE
jgi:hypothetical protein